jgi:metallo-beta-lactamase family protein
MEENSQNKSTLHFYGGAGSVTGANFMFESGGLKLLVDCGLEQGGSFAEDSNYEPFQYSPGDIPYLFVTHAHLDHIGRIPKLVREGFKGKIISSEATKALAAPLLKDSMGLLEQAAKKSNKPILYDEKDIAGAAALWEGVPYHKVIELDGGFSVRLLDAGHILGSSMVEITRAGRKIIFTGDLGNDHSRLVGPTEVVSDANYLVMESVYGDKKQEGIEDRVENLENTIENSIAKSGTLLIPAFSTERTQELLFDIRDLLIEKRVPSVPVYLDSPLAQEVTEAFLAYPQYFRQEIAKRLEGGENVFSFPELHFVHDSKESLGLHEQSGPKIIIAGSGMSAGGRILAHEQAYLGDKRNTLLIVGYQAAGSLGRALFEGEKNITIHGERIAVQADVEANFGYSAHRDRDGLSSFVHESHDTLNHVFVTMGEPRSSLYLVQHIRDYLGLNANAPEKDSSAEISL